MNDKTDSLERLPASDLLCEALMVECCAKIGMDEISQLERDEIKILYFRFVEGRTLKETGIIIRNKINTNPAPIESVRLRQNSAIKKLRRIISHNRNFTQPSCDNP
jgi:hypothetical protein